MHRPRGMAAHYSAAFDRAHHQMRRNELVGHVLAEGLMPHHAQIVVHERGHPLALDVFVEARLELWSPEL